MHSFFNDIEHYLETLKTTLDRLDRQEINQFENLLLDAYHNEATVFIFGNGGSAATASHFAGDLNKGVSHTREKRFRVISLVDNLPTLMAYANDLSYDEIFVEPLKNFIKPGDLVIGISGSGNSPNVLKAIEYANLQGNITVGLTGYSGGMLREIAQYSVNANIHNMQIAEDVHIILNHLTNQLLCGHLDELLKEAELVNI